MCANTPPPPPNPFLSQLLEFRKQVSETEFIFWFEIKSVAAVRFQLAGMQGAGKMVLLLPWCRWGRGAGAMFLLASKGHVDKEKRQESDSGHERFLNPFYFVRMCSGVYTRVYTGISTHLSVCW